jgi:hypothetical protein
MPDVDVTWQNLEKAGLNSLAPTKDSCFVSADDPKDAVSMAFYGRPSAAEKGKCSFPRRGRHMLEELDRK